MSGTSSAHSHLSSASSVYSRSEVIAAIQDYYSLLIRLPYISPDALVYPPAEGWSGVNVEGLRSKGKTEEVIELLRHLPYLRAPAPGWSWMIGPDTVEIAYCDGEVYGEAMDDLQPVPGHCIWLTMSDSSDGTSLLLDTHAGTITEWTNLEHKVMMDYEEYEKLPIPDKWMAHATMGVAPFFKLWKRKLERLIWMVLYNGRVPGMAQWYVTAKTLQEEEDMLASDDDFEVDADEHGDAGRGASNSEREDNMDEEDEQISDQEVDDLMKDAYGENASREREDLQSQADDAEYRPENPSPSKHAEKREPDMSSLDRKTKACSSPPSTNL